jgi:hypothetical protein
MRIALSHRVRHHQEQIPPNLAKRLSALFAINNAILHKNTKRIQKHMAGFFETNLVLALIGEVFYLVPFEPDSWHNNIIIAIL